VKNRFQSLPFKCKPAALQHGVQVTPLRSKGTVCIRHEHYLPEFTVVGLCTLNQVDP
jgi:hypothetical protein